MSDENDLLTKLETRREAYRQLYAGSGALLGEDHIVWTERTLLKLIRAVYGRRLEQIGEFLESTHY